MPHIFISYAKKDTRQLAENLYHVLNAVPGLTAWMDMSLEADSSWAHQIMEEIDRCDYLVVLLSPDVNRSAKPPNRRSFVLNEIDYAQQFDKPILPVMAINTSQPVQIAGIQYIDLTRTPTDPTPVVERVLKRFGLAAPLPPPGPPLELEPSVSILNRTIKPRLLIGGISFVLVAVLGISIALLNNNGGPLLPIATSPVALQPTDPPDTATNPPAPTPTDTVTWTPSVTLTPPPTLEIALIVGTLDAEATIAQGTLSANSTAAARATDYARGTQSALDQTATATLWTSTPTPNITASIEAFRTQRAATETQAFVAGQTATAASWTDTPTPTPTLTFTPTPTFTPTVTPLPPGFTSISRNADWTPITQDFDGVTMVLVPAGCFDMGSEDGGDDEKPVNQQCFDAPFWIDQTEVTQADFERLGGEKANSNGFDGDQRPVERITWFEARDFCALRGMRLPTEREWEYAARGPDNVIYPWGDDWNPDNVVWSGNSNSQTAPVGSRPAGVSWVGALDLSGNVWEWVSTLSRAYPYVFDDGREDGDNGTDARVQRGGSWDYGSTYLRAPGRFTNVPDPRYNYNGFRCARSS